MILRNTSLARRVFVPTLCLFVISIGALFAIQHKLDVRGFEDTLAAVEDATLTLKREAARDLLTEIKVATERSLQRNEYEQFSLFAEQQRQLAEVQEFSFIGENGTIQLSSKNDLIGKSVDADLWKKTVEAKEPVVQENEAAFTMLYPLRVDADMHRLQPEKKIGQPYGALRLEFSKEKINRMLADARGTFQDRVARSLMLSGAAGGAALLLMAIALYPLVVRPLVRTLSGVISNLTARSDVLVGISQRITGSSQQLASSASEQASSLEETSSAMEQMAAMTRANAENAQRANALVVQAQKTAAGGDQTVTQLNQAMAAINESAGRIGKIIKVIEEIAFQTNLLALNAAVEAARAGEQGRGFAVVATEVRTLAQRAAEAARETTGLIEDAVGRSREGTQVAAAVGQSLGTIVTDVSHVSELIGGIAKASEEQAEGVQQVNSALSQMNKVTQENAAAAGESSSVAEQLGDQARTVREMVNELVAIVSGAREKRTSTAREREAPMHAECADHGQPLSVATGTEQSDVSVAARPHSTAGEQADL